MSRGGPGAYSSRNTHFDIIGCGGKERVKKLEQSNRLHFGDKNSKEGETRRLKNTGPQGPKSAPKMSATPKKDTK